MASYRMTMTPDLGHQSTRLPVMETAERFGRADTCRVRVLTPAVLATLVYCEAAIVYRLPESVCNAVEELRTALPLDAPPSEQLTPHLTILHLGHQSARDLGALAGHLSNIKTAALGFEGFGVFRTGTNHINLHLRVAPRDDLDRVQRTMLGLAHRLRQENISNFIGPQFCPHVTLWDGAPSRTFDAQNVPALPVSQQRFDLNELIMIGRLG
ncbi:MAG: 2'-5' RNA ligase family protein [Alteraurantiacibacter sp.]